MLVLLSSLFSTGSVSSHGAFSHAFSPAFAVDAAVVVGQPFIFSGDEFAFEIRVRFPGPTNNVLVASSTTGSILTLSSGSVQSAYCALWYEKVTAGSLTGNIYLTSSAGRLQITGAPIFNDRFYNMSVVRESITGSTSLRVLRYESDELIYSASVMAFTGAVGALPGFDYSTVEVGSSNRNVTSTQFWGQEFRLWRSSLNENELHDHARNFESYGRDQSFSNGQLLIHWRMDDDGTTDLLGTTYSVDSTLNRLIGTGSDFIPDTRPYDKFLNDYAYIPSIDYGWNQEKVRVFDGSRIDPRDAYTDQRFASLEFNLYDALNEDISHVLTSFDEMGDVIGLPTNRYREDYEGLCQMRETYFKRLQGPLNFRVFVDMLDFFDSSFVKIVEKLLPARTAFTGDELIVESHMLERPKYQYQFRPVHEGRIEISGSISIVDRGDDFD